MQSFSFINFWTHGKGWMKIKRSLLHGHKRKKHYCLVNMFLWYNHFGKKVSLFTGPSNDIWIIHTIWGPLIHLGSIKLLMVKISSDGPVNKEDPNSIISMYGRWLNVFLWNSLNGSIFNESENWSICHYYNLARMMKKKKEALHQWCWII